MAGLPESAKQEIKLRMTGLNGADSRRVALELAASYHVSETTVYRHSRELRKVVERTTRGQRRLPVEEKVLKKMMAMSIQNVMTATDVVDVFEKNGLIENGLISPAWFTRYLKKQRMSRKEMKIDRRPYRRFEASEPGEVLQVDGSTALQWYIDDDGSVGWESTVSRNKNRPGNRKKRLEFFIAMDDHSRSVYGEFMTGKTTNHWLNFLFNTFKKKDDPRFIFHGVPRTIYMDNDAVAKNPKFSGALHTALGVDVKKHKPTKKTDRFSNARSKGKVERFIGYVSQKMRKTKGRKFQSLEEANRFMLELCLEYNLRRHSTTGEIPFQRWNKIRPEMLIQCEDDKLYQALYRDEFTCHVYNNLVIRLDGEWQLPWEEPFYSMIGQKIQVFRHPLEQDQLYIQWQGREYVVERQGQALRAFSEGPVRQAKTERQAMIEQLEEEDLSGIQLYGFDQGPEEGVAYLPPKEGVELDTSKFVPEPPRINRHRAMKTIARMLEQEALTPEQNKILTSRLGPQVTEEEIESAFQELSTPAVCKTG